jgi:hypothetical protein
MIILFILYAYLALGMLVGFIFVFMLIHHADHSLHGAPLALRLILLPASALLWPWVLAKYLAKTNQARPDKV